MEDLSIYINDNKENQNSEYIFVDKNAQVLQHRLLEMGFELTMINKVIIHLQVKTTQEALRYLIKNENDGLWEHPFIPIEEKPVPNLSQGFPKPNTEQLLNQALTTIGSGQKLCDICGEPIQNHRIQNNNKEEEIIPKENNQIQRDPNIIIVQQENKKEEENKNDKEDEKENEQICGICLGELENPVDIEKCHHKFCLDCFQDYLNNKIMINDIEAIPCPSQKCTNKALTEDFFIQYLNEEFAYKYASFKSKNEIAKDPYKIFCPICESYAEIPKENPLGEKLVDNNQLPQTVMTCIKNNHKFCSCGRPLHEGKCYVPGEDLKKFIQKEKIKKCPKCGFLIKKDHGCNHMICGNPQCKYEFCWLCMNESLPDHYRFGSCKGMQFADEDGLLFKIRRYPCLVCLYKLFMCIFVFLLLLLTLACPLLLFVYIGYVALFEHRRRAIVFKKPLSSGIEFFVRVVSFSCLCLTLILISPWFYFFYTFCLAFLLCWLTYSVLKCIFYCLFTCFCCCFIQSQNNNDPGLLNAEQHPVQGEGNNVVL